MWIPYHHGQSVMTSIKLTDLVKSYCHSEVAQNLTFILHVSVYS